MDFGAADRMDQAAFSGERVADLKNLMRADPVLPRLNNRHVRRQSIWHRLSSFLRDTSLQITVHLQQGDL
jgi:hypothetical protein